MNVNKVSPQYLADRIVFESDNPITHIVVDQQEIPLEVALKGWCQQKKIVHISDYTTGNYSIINTFNDVVPNASSIGFSNSDGSYFVALAPLPFDMRKIVLFDKDVGIVEKTSQPSLKKACLDYLIKNQQSIPTAEAPQDILEEHSEIVEKAKLEEKNNKKRKYLTALQSENPVEQVYKLARTGIITISQIESTYHQARVKEMDEAKNSFTTQFMNSCFSMFLGLLPKK